ncbi:hypothetical protein TYRP_021316 [Tyrophagus putrescentiae]|nr:hypothetical protein TYRP_021316 [Tyrophagus putrescentiae]
MKLVWIIFYAVLILYRCGMFLASYFTYRELSCDRFTFVNQVQPLFDQLEIPLGMYFSTPCGINELWLTLQGSLIICTCVGKVIAYLVNRRRPQVPYDPLAAADEFHARTR